MKFVRFLGFGMDVFEVSVLQYLRRTET